MTLSIPLGHVSSCKKHDAELAMKELEKAISRRKPVTDEFYNSHYDYVSCVSNELESLNINTRSVYATRVEKHNWLYEEERVVKHNKIIEQYLSSWENIPRDRKGVITGGLIGSGKTSTMRYHAGMDMNDYALLSADMMKIHFVEHNLVPPLQGFLPLEASVLTYKETNHVTWRLFELAIERGINIVFDTMMADETATLGKILPLLKNGYAIDGIFVDVTIETALRRMKSRHRAGLDNFIVHGRGHGGRLLPEKSITEQQSVKTNSINRDVFDKITEQGFFSDIQIFDNNIDDKKPTRIK